MRYWMMRLFLVSRAEGTIFATLEPKETRQQYIQRAFGSEMRFQYRGEPLVYKPFKSPIDSFICAVIGREHPVTVSGPPEEQFAPKTVPDWEHANIFIDSSGGNEGQKIAMQQVGVVGQPLAVMRALVDYINFSQSNAEWSIAANPITRKEEFWSAVDRYKDHIKELDLEFVTPNIWGGESATEKALKELKKQNNAQEVEVRIKNKDGKLNPDSENIRQSVDYITRGGGSLRVKSDTDGVVYSSENEESIVKETPDEDAPIPSAEPSLIMRIIKKIFG